MSARASEPAEESSLTRGLPVLVCLVSIGGVAGSLGRYAISQACAGGLAGPALGTLVVNVVGCLAIGALLAVIRGSARERAWRALFVTGVLGGFTTFSGIAVDAVDMADRGSWIWAGGYLLITLLAGLWAPRIGRAIVMRCWRRA